MQIQLSSAEHSAASVRRERPRWAFAIRAIFWAAIEQALDFATVAGWIVEKSVPGKEVSDEAVRVLFTPCSHA